MRVVRRTQPLKCSPTRADPSCVWRLSVSRMRTGAARATSAAVLPVEAESARVRKSGVTRVLVVEDSASDLMLLKEALRPVAGQLEILSADTLRAGLECADDDDVNVMLLDLGLPDSDGLPTLQTAIRE